jgi:signal transduction histidine kinase/ligand-binding sensor domain-containing protein/DNA-binding response OmpR family regulator
MIKKYIAIVCILLSLPGRAQEVNFNFYNYNSTNGLSTDLCQFVYRDAYGFLWLASFDGLFRWDGYTFKKYIHSDSNASSIDNNITYTIFEDSRKRLWIGTIGGLNLYDRTTDAFIKCTIRTGSNPIPVNAILEDSKHQLWLGTSYGLCKYDHDRRQNQWFLSGEDIIFCMTLDAEDNIWVGAFNKGIKKFSQATGTFQSFHNDANDPHSLPADKRLSILAASDGNIWVGTEDQGIMVLNKNGRLIKRYQTFSKEAPGVQNSVSCLYEDKDHTIWIGLRRSVLYYMKPGDTAPHPVTNNALNNTREKLMSIFTIREDEFGNTWFGTQGNGLFYTNRYKNIFHNYLQQPGPLDDQRTRDINNFYEDKQGRVWIATNGNGLLLFNAANQSVSQPAPALLRTDAINDVKGDADGTIWMATWAAGIKSYNPATGLVQQYQHNPADTNSLLQNDVKAILPDDSLVWIGTHGEGLAAFNKRTKQFIDYRNNKTIPFNMHDPAWINHLYKDSRKRLWISTYSGVFVFDGIKLTRHEHRDDTSTISNNSVNMVTEDAKGNTWIISELGLDRFDDRTGKFVRYTAARYNLPATMKAIVAKDNVLWITSNEGMVVFDPATLQVKKYNTNDGLAENTFQKTLMISKAGQCYAGGSRGFSVFNPDSLRPLHLPAYFYFTDLYIYNELQQAGAGQSALQKVLAFTDTLVLKHTQSFFSVGFTAINLYASSKTKYSYQLESLHDQWIDAGNDRKVSFTNLQPGQYNLRIRYTNADGQWQEAPKTLHIVVLPPWWQTWWFKVLAAVLVITGITLLFYLRLAAIRKRNILLKAEVGRQTKELQEINAALVEQRDEITLQKENLEQSNEEVVRQSDKILHQQQYIMLQNQELAQTVAELEKLNHTKDHFFSILAHDLKNPVAALTDISDFMKHNLQRMDKKELERYLDSMHHSSAAVYELLINLLNWSRTQSKKMESAPVAVNLAELVNKNLRLLEPQLGNKHISPQVNIDPALYVFVDYHMIDTAIRNILGNSVKFTDYNGKVTIDASLKDHAIELRIGDNGMGMTSEQQEKLFSLDKTIITAGTAGEKGTGLGLVITREFIEINKGHIRVESAPGKGATFYISLPVSEAGEGMNGTAAALPAAMPVLDFWEAFPVDRLLKIKGSKLLLVDDSKEMRDYLKLILADTFEIFEAANGQEGLKMATEILPAAIITDLLMPGMGGLQFCREIKSKTPTSHLPVIILTSQWEDNIKASGYEAGADVYLTKPVKKELLIQVILNLLNKQERLHEHVWQNMQEETPFQAANLAISKLDEEFLQKLVQFIEENIADPNLDARLLSREMATSRTILYTKVKTLTGQTVHEFIKSIRLKRSLPLLLEGRLSINQVAYEVGFNSHSYFDKCFAKQYKMGPKEYINKKRKKS